MSDRVRAFPWLSSRAAANLIVASAGVAASANSFRGGYGGSIHGSVARGISCIQR